MQDVGGSRSIRALFRFLIAASFSALMGCSIQVARTDYLSPVTQQTSSSADASVISARASAKMDHNCALISDGSLRCWGSNASGESGTGDTARLSGPEPVRNLRDAIGVATGAQHTCVLKIGGSVLCWGDNSHYQLGNGTQTPSFSPTPVTDLDGSSPSKSATALAGGLNHTCALLGDRTVKCWGGGASGQIGDGHFQDAPHPTPVSGLSMVVALAAGADSTCASIPDSPWLTCWGDNTYGQLGDGTFQPQPAPVPVVGLAGLPRALAVGGDFACAALNRIPWFLCWGSNNRGQFGNGNTVSSAIPVPAAGNWYAFSVGLAAGDQFICARLSTGEVECWGDHSFGQLGDGHALGGYSVSPLRVEGLSRVIEISAGSAHACAILSDGSMRCWGRNSEGQLGGLDGSPSSLPERVNFR